MNLKTVKRPAITPLTRQLYFHAFGEYSELIVGGERHAGPLIGAACENIYNRLERQFMNMASVIRDDEEWSK